MDPNNNNGGGDRNLAGITPQRGYALNGKIMLSAIVILFTVLLLILFLHLYVRWHVLRRATRRARRRRLVFAGEGQSPPLPANRGLDPDVLKSLSVLVYSASDDDSEGGGLVECAVCLSEFEEGEKVRNLPQCGHRFHIECIDMWFHSHSTCPLCRSPVEAKAPAPAADSGVILAMEETERPQAATIGCSAPADLCPSCRAEDAMGSSSNESGGGELRIDVPARRVDGFRGSEEEPGLGSPAGLGFKSPGSRILALKKLLSMDLRLYRGGSSVAERDLERAEGAE